MDKVNNLIVPALMRKYLLGLVLTLISWYGYAQGCNCPLPASCGPCQGGINSLTLRFNPTLSLPALITALDGATVVFSGLVNPGSNFSFDGTLADGRFATNQVTLAVDGIYNTVIDTSCGSSIFVNSTFGSFVVTSAASLNGGAICCAPADVDKVVPVLSNCPAIIWVSTATTTCSGPATWTPPTASDNCGSVTLVGSHSPGATFPLGTTTVTYTATDSYGNKTTCTFNVVVSDNAAPTIRNCPASLILSAGQNCQAAATWTPPTATDNCTSAVKLTSTHQPGMFPLGQTMVTYTATDDAGNFSTCSFNVVVEDKTPPVLANCPADILVTADANSCQAVVLWTEPTFTDNCEKGELTSSHKPGDVFPVGVTQVEYKASDASGNVSQCYFNITVKSNEPPVITDCPGDIRAEADESGEVSVTWTPPTASSRCGMVSLTSSHNPGDLFSVGTTKVEYIATDDSGSEAKCAFDVIVSYKKVTLEVVQVVTPNGDGINDEWIITNLEDFKNNKVTIFDRWGSMIYRASGYDNESVVWKGENKNGTLVPTGTYFYTIEVDFKEQHIEKNGFIELVQ